jgi:hypothetical protein
MLDHPALYRMHTPLRPQQKMAANERCWCGSGVKWKKCHRDRAEQNPIGQHAWLGTFNRARRIGTCQHPLAPADCSGESIGSHAVQRKRLLASIAEDGHVYSRRDYAGPKSRRGHPDLVGLNKASTFPGFCSLHDGETFKPVDQLNLIDARAAFLLSYRSLCFEVHMKQVAMETLADRREYIDRGQPFSIQAARQQSLAEDIHLMGIGYREHLRRKLEWDGILLERKYKGFRFAAFDLPENFPILASGTFFHEYDFIGRYLQPPGRLIHTYDLLAFNMARSLDGLRLVFGWVESEPSGATFVESLASLPSDRFLEAVVRFCWDITDNMFIRPSWWNAKSDAEKETLAQFGLASLPGGRSPGALVPDGTPAFQI